MESTYSDMMKSYGFVPMNHEKPLWFPVETQPIYDARGKIIPGHQAVVRGDSGDTLAVHTDKYSLVPYQQHFEIFERAIEQSSLDSTDMQVGSDMSDNGAKIFRQYVLPAHTMMLDTASQKRPIALRLYMFDSYDGSTAWQGRAGFFDFCCANAAIYGTETASFRFKHLGEMIEKIEHAAAMLTRASETFIEQFPRLQKWPNIHLDTAHFSELIDALPQSNERLIDNLTAEYGRSQYGTLWDAHQLLTSWSTHGIPARTQADRQKRVAALVESSAWRHCEGFEQSRDF